MELANETPAVLQTAEQANIAQLITAALVPFQARQDQIALKLLQLDAIERRLLSVEIFQKKEQNWRHFADQRQPFALLPNAEGNYPAQELPQLRELDDIRRLDDNDLDAYLHSYSLIAPAPDVPPHLTQENFFTGKL